MTDEPHALQVHIIGRVQRVGYRDWTRRQAIELGLTGWVRNEADGSVSVLIVGSPPAVATMVKRFWKGPQLASVSNVVAEATGIAERPEDFRIVR